RCHYSAVQNWNSRTVSYLTSRARLDQDARLDTVFTTVGGAKVKVDAGAILAGKGAESNMYGLAIGDRAQHFDHHTVHLHESGHTRSDLHFKVALRDRANSVYTGLIRIDERADYCEAYQENRNLVLSPEAKAESIPELEIMNNEVRCTHGATVGKIDPQEIFYLMSRGIGKDDAVHLIVAGFVAPILDQVPPVMRDRIENIVLARLEGREQHG
ncbi:MAG TPA: SufD family Fe-S cluster assembly protein, partial [bacterium]|nr:SufD family Fe-S cluster assembly protein [bacterium]